MSFYYIIYNALIIGASFLYLPYLFIKSRILHTKSNILERLGISFKECFSYRECIWFHAASVGEVLAASPIIKEVKEEFPDKKVILSVWTSSGFEVALGKIKFIDLVFYFPLDIYWIVKRILRKINPYLIIILETEIWPNFLQLANKMSIPVVLANGRISKKSIGKYRNIPNKFLKEVLNKFSLLCMQSEKELQNIVSLEADPRRVKVCGNTKFDQICSPYEEKEKEQLRESLGLSTQDKIIIAGSTRKGENELFIDVFNTLRKNFKDLKLIIAPRHLERINEIENILKSKNLSYFKRTQKSKKEAEVIILDTIGELVKFFHLSSIVIMGGSFVPVGGHNILEPAFAKKPIIIGPYMENFADIAELFMENKACIQVNDKANLLEVLKDLLFHEEKSKNYGLNAYKVLLSNQGTSKRIVEEIKILLSG